MNTNEPILKRFMIEVKSYPNGEIFIKTFPVGGATNFQSKKKKVVKEITSKESNEEVFL